MSEGQSPPSPQPDALVDIDTRFTRWLVRWRFVFFALLAILVVMPFNGQWRIGLDSSLYRGVAQNLVEGNGYTFAGMKLRNVFAVADAHPLGFNPAAPPSPIGEARGWPGGSVVWTVLAVVGPLAWCCGSHGRRAAIPCACLAAMARQAEK